MYSDIRIFSGAEIDSVVDVTTRLLVTLEPILVNAFIHLIRVCKPSHGNSDN